MSASTRPPGPPAWVAVPVLTQLSIAVVNRLTVGGLAAPAPGTRHDVTDPVTVCVPARDEADHIAAVVADLRAQRGVGTLRIVVLDDGSTDGTGDLARTAADGDPRVEVLDGGGDPPPGWTGKAWAIERMTRGRLTAAPSDGWLCFVDADVRLRPDAIAAAVALLRDEDRRRPGGTARRAAQPVAAPGRRITGGDPAAAAAVLVVVHHRAHPAQRAPTVGCDRVGQRPVPAHADAGAPADRWPPQRRGLSRRRPRAGPHRARGGPGRDHPVRP
ncbi:MAG: glycosyltransferase family 2 protein [Gordonia paraffinivorans]